MNAIQEWAPLIVSIALFAAMFINAVLLYAQSAKDRYTLPEIEVVTRHKDADSRNVVIATPVRSVAEAQGFVNMLNGVHLPDVYVSVDGRVTYVCEGGVLTKV